MVHDCKVHVVKYFSILVILVFIYFSRPGLTVYLPLFGTMQTRLVWNSRWSCLCLPSAIHLASWWDFKLTLVWQYCLEPNNCQLYYCYIHICVLMSNKIFTGEGCNKKLYFVSNPVFFAFACQVVVLLTPLGLMAVFSNLIFKSCYGRLV